jgi:uncharacterized protein (DUF1778 family)
MSYARTPDSSTPDEPRKKKPKTRKQVLVRVPFQLIDDIDSAARRRGMSRSAYMLAATMEKVEQGLPR